MGTSIEVPGAEGLSGKLWPVHIKPLEDELLSSWLVRLARAHGLRLHTFCDLAWWHKAIWNRDIDKSADEEILRVLSEKTATPIERVRQTTLAAYEGWLYEKHNSYGNTRWIMPVGVYHRTRKRPGLQYCPMCLREDEDPYFRRRWRLAFVTLCERHGRLLLDRCPRCRAPVNFHRNQVDMKSITVCFGCGFDLCKAGRHQQICRFFHAREQQILMDIARRGWIEVPDSGLVYSHLWFDVLHQLMKLLLMGRGTQCLYRLVVKSMANQGVHTRPMIKEVERLEADDRTRLIVMATWLLDQWPRRFIDACGESDILSSVLFRDMKQVPFWYWAVVHGNLYEPSYVVSDEEVRSATAYLLSVGKKPKERTISRLLGVGQVFRKRRVFLGAGKQPDAPI